MQITTEQPEPVVRAFAGYSHGTWCDQMTTQESHGYSFYGGSADRQGQKSGRNEYAVELKAMPWLLSLKKGASEYGLPGGNEAPESRKEPALSAVGLREMVQTCQATLGLTAADLARCVGVSRPALYKHLKEGAPRDLEPYHRLYLLALRIEREVGPVGRAHRSVLVDGKTFVRHLCESPWEEDYLVDVARRVVANLAGQKPAELPDVVTQRLIARSVTTSG